MYPVDGWLPLMSAIEGFMAIITFRPSGRSTAPGGVITRVLVAGSKSYRCQLPSELSVRLRSRVSVNLRDGLPSDLPVLPVVVPVELPEHVRAELPINLGGSSESRATRLPARGVIRDYVKSTMVGVRAASRLPRTCGLLSRSTLFGFVHRFHRP